MPAFVAAEIGINHNGEMTRIWDAIDAAKRTGADAIKFQAYNTDALVRRRGIAPDAKLGEQNLVEVLRRCELTDEHLDIISQRCKHLGFKWFASVFDPSQVRRVLGFGACALKIGHAEEQWDELRDACYDREDADCRVFISHATGSKSERIGDVMCRAEYPATSRPLLDSVGGEMGYRGFSSHYQDYRIPAAAALRGAEYIEAHLKLSAKDHEAAWSLSEADFTAMVKQIREYESWL